MTEIERDRTPRQRYEARLAAESHASTADGMSRTVFEALRRVKTETPDRDVAERADELFHEAVELSKDLDEFHETVETVLEDRRASEYGENDE